MIARRTSAALLVLCPMVMGLGACAGGPRGPGGPGGPPPGRMGPSLFVSPFGEPFEAGPDEPWPVAAWFAGADADMDGQLDAMEFEADGLRYFQVLDVDRDGVIGQAEIQAYEAMAEARSMGRGPGPGGRGGSGGRGPGADHARNPPALLADATGQDGGMGRPPGGGGRGGPPGGGRRGGPGGTERSIWAMAGLLNVPEPVKAADVDVNQRITPQEWSVAGARWFRLLDKDGDGALTLAELPQTQLQRGGVSGGLSGGGRRPPR